MLKLGVTTEMSITCLALEVIRCPSTRTISVLLGGCVSYPTRTPGATCCDAITPASEPQKFRRHARIDVTPGELRQSRSEHRSIGPHGGPTKCRTAAATRV